ncbi:MFS transporter [Ramlibacter sp.]|uniref:MFS transporter n=1 Tax=Ramlibacter sp. TaxID=1917967 RepID=UPI0017BEC0D1|nr:MFS transporter [Ramlibacter sp.]MBA2675880.1 MFS transporter [Ramlibacter sp.]
MPLALFALTAGAFCIGTTEFVIMGLLMQVGADLHVSITTAGLLISGYALGVAAGAPVLSLLTRRLPRKTVLMALMAIFTLGNIACALAPSYGLLMAARILTSLAHGTFFGVGAVVAGELVAPHRRASAIALMFLGLTVATVAGVPAGALLGLHYGWRAAFGAVAVLGLVALLLLACLLPRTPAPLSTSLGEELAVLRRPAVLAGLAMTVLGFAGVFCAYTYIQPLLVQVTGLSQQAVSVVLLLFGVGLVIGNLLGGKAADRAPVASVLVSLALLAAVLAVLPLVMHSGWAVGLYVGVLGAAAFATVAPLQMRVLKGAQGAGQTLASSLNIAAFNVGNALGAWLGGRMLDSAWGFDGLGAAGAAVTLLGLGTAVAEWRLSARRAPPPAHPTAPVPRATRQAPGA